MKRVFLRFLMFLSLLVQINWVYAQDFNVGVAYNQATTVVHDGTIYMLPGEVLDISIELEGVEDIYSVNTAKLYVGSSVFNLVTKVQDNRVEFENVSYTPSVYNQDLSLRVEFEYNIIAEGKNGSSYLVTQDLSYNHDVKLHLKETPQIERVTGLNSRYYYAGVSIPLEVYTNGGNADGWNFGWPTGSTVSSECTFTTSANGTQMAEGCYDNSFEVVITNYAPDGETVWFTDTKSFELYTYPTPAAEITNRDFTIQESEEIVLSPTIKGGNASTWAYKWYKDASLVAETREFKILGVNISENPLLQEYRLVVTNSLTGTDNDYEVEIPINVTVNGITFAWKDELPRSVVEGDTIDAGIIRTGGSAYEWKYTWSNDSEEIPGTDVCSFIAPAGTVSGRNVSLAFMAELLDSNVSQEMVFDNWTSTNNSSNSISQNSYTLNVVNGSVLSFDWSVSSESGYDWLIVTLDGNEILKKSGSDSGSYSKTFTTTGTMTLVVKYTKDGGVSSGSDIGKIYNIKLTTDPYTQTKTHEYVVYSQPTGEKTSSDDIALLHGQEYTFSISTEGGLPSGWTYEWFLDGVKINGATSEAYTAKAQNNSNDVKYFVYKVIAQNATNNITRQLEYEFNTEVWPAALETHSDLSCDVYYGDYVPLAIDVTGGYKDGWRYEWIVDGYIVSTVATYNYYAENQNTDSKTQKIYLKAYNEHEKSPFSSLFSTEIEFTVTSWSHGNVEMVNNLNNYRSGDPISVSVNVYGGYPNWRYDWYYEGELIHSSSEATYTFTAEDNYNDNDVKDRITVVATNTIPKSGASKSDQVYKDFTIWPVVDFPDEVTVGTVEYDGVYFIREGNELPIYVDYATGGYNAYNDSYWNYKWSVDGTVVKNSNNNGKNTYTESMVSGSNSSTKAVADKDYSLTMVNTSPYGDTWYSKTYNIPVKVYSKPKVPKNLVIKGNGNSNTLVCMCDLSDVTLENREYRFVFGYTDAYGEDHFMEPTTKRWYQFDSKISIKNPNYTFWVIARWDYSSEIYVTSGRRYLNGAVDDLFDASCFNNISVTTRGGVGDETTDIEQVAYDDVKFDGTNLIANASSLVDGVVEIFSIDGKRIDIIDLGRKLYFNEKIDFSEYESGIYIINIRIGEMLVNRKVLVP